MCEEYHPDTLLLSMVAPPLEDGKTFLTIKEHYNNFQKSRDSDFISYLIENISEDEIKAIESVQQGTEEWLETRVGRITASNADAVRSLRNVKRSKSLIKSIMGIDSVSNKYTEHGKKNEPFGRSMYIVNESVKHKDLSVSECGLVVSPTNPFMGASPDGLVTCSCCSEKRVLEIKCPFNGWKNYPADIPKLFPDYHLYLDKKGNLKLKETSPWYSQVNFQMGVLGLRKVDLVIHTQVDTAVIPIEFDSERWNVLKDKSKYVFINAVIPQL